MAWGKKQGSTASTASENAWNNISKGTVIVGNITTKGDVRVEGKIVGTITCNAKLVVAESGVIEGNIDARKADIGGEVKGTVVIRELLQLLQKGKILGDIFTQKLAVEVGANFSGTCKMGDEAKQVLDKAPEMMDELSRDNAHSAAKGANNGSANIRKNQGIHKK